MPKLQQFDVKLKTGASGRSTVPRYSINGFLLDFEHTGGGTGPGEEFQALGNPDSFPHTLLLIGPDDGAWDIADISITYHCAGEPPYSLRFAGVTLDGESDLNIWQTRPQPAFDV